ncbi:bifunctional diaminohydroxyphosphoribosylaminopyrimidine deaminase/5-amino-6-(5-phosphoribosylamino)uracil reductase RibD [Staphylococcus caprae]|uniref:bifunctional diaminohydroxyphosphoribosylaminopyrimidine deaminase/5-amino-6-(5-phosphoribosylamino)uracil reductase RibD n=1 Tax=Staphylococcus caprae TaxID=29380 RepID=UPI000E6864E9|nr:bifunctional diaminohydroxyphosphoribosylaminopyrimidine deaminase/5-amino-6-(5-phosphoribosylamino)uracil reductase RibD [Staphylococcus caprae]MBU5270642.1 bifunctional diaminohydroxyphosphoribosylaminopyrimidine deaminase/5-amino-6-(5-phosphoribosylamino)uracil reductase RibD [Staphylococcus caprae]MDK6297718.1 bifunctional diaminohydroxyphosphoribosylaminopyrimidine deaminase/5-amino-6-(5-phosphoribosylamino)uracil reductase RibD [Staphylococcus caprae]MDK7232171.1 bifunctional diaminohyd
MSRFMNYAIQLAQMVDGQTGINPPVGSVVVKDGRIVGLGAHLKKGDKHAEVQALDMAGQAAKDATIYVSLEPCTHHGSTPPCVDKIIEFGIKKVIYAVKDTTLVSKGDEILKEAGIEVEFQFNEDAAELYKDFFPAKRKGIPELTVKVSSSLDGKQATDLDESKWITNKEVKEDVYQLRHEHDAVVTGRKTIEADDPLYTTRVPDGKNPIRVILSKTGDINFEHQLFKDITSQIWIYTENEKLKNNDKHIEIIYMQECETTEILKDLYRRGIGKLLVEAGPNITSQFLQSDHLNELILYLAPKLIGGSGKHQFFKTDEVIDLPEATQFEIVYSKLINQNIKLKLRKK